MTSPITTPSKPGAGFVLKVKRLPTMGPKSVSMSHCDRAAVPNYEGDGLRHPQFVPVLPLDLFEFRPIASPNVCGELSDGLTS